MDSATLALNIPITHDTSCTYDCLLQSDREGHLQSELLAFIRVHSRFHFARIRNESRTRFDIERRSSPDRRVCDGSVECPKSHWPRSRRHPEFQESTVRMETSRVTKEPRIDANERQWIVLIAKSE